MEQRQLSTFLEWEKTEASPCPDVFLLDLILPSADGPQILPAFRKHPECAQTPIIIVTSSEAPKDRARVAELGISSLFQEAV